ncbi:pentapeptide repeat-containing protein [Asanoa ferruginea]|nr:pentapeptide repeat-containing protein [Asanoa ferruginea]
MGTALAVLGRRLMIVGGAVSLLEDVDLRAADLEDLDLTRAVLRHSTLAA